MAEVADVVVKNAKVFTAAEEGGSPFATGFAVADGRFVAVVSDDSELNALVGPQTQVRDLGGAPVVPGLFDDHIHHVFGGRMLVKEFQIDSRADLDGVLATVAERVARTVGGDWIVGSGWGSTLVPAVSTAAARKRLDAVTGECPAVLSDDSHHNVWANTAALEAAGIDVRRGADLPEGAVWDAAAGELSGAFFEGAAEPVRAAQRAADSDSPEDMVEYARAAWTLLHSLGVTAVQDAAIDKGALDALVTLDRSGELDGWVACSLTAHSPMGDRGGMSPEMFIDYAVPLHRDRVRTTFTKLAIDGVPSTRTAAMHAPYLPSPEHGHDHHGSVYLTVDELVEVLRLYREKGLHTKIHATGDRGVTVVLDAYARLRDEGSTQVYQIAHGQFVTPEDRRRMAELDIVAEISPFLWYPGVIVSSFAEVLASEIAEKPQPNRDLIDLGVLVAGGSDWSVTPVPNLWLGIGGLVTRQDPEGALSGALWPEQAVSVEEAMRIFTINGAKAALLDEVVGSIEIGKAANYLVIDRDVFEIDPADIGATRVLETVVAGRTVYVRREE